MSAIYTRRRRSQSFGSFSSFKEQLAAEKPLAAAKPELIEGYAHLCFDEKGHWFRGILLTADAQSFTLSGRTTTQLELTEENDVTVLPTDSPDVLRDFPSPLRTPPTRAEIKPQEISSGSTSRQDSIDSRTERELQFILEELPEMRDQQSSPMKEGSPPTLMHSMSRPGSPPSTQQIIKALDNLLIQSFDGENKPDMDSPLSSFRSRSGSRSNQPLESVSVMFDITVSDLEEGSQHNIRNVAGRKGNNLTLRNRQLCFVTERSFWGQRADMVIQKQLAAPEMVGQRCHVFAGPMRFYFYNPLTSGPSSLTNWCW